MHGIAARLWHGGATLAAPGLRAMLRRRVGRGKEIAARVALKSNSGLITDAVDVSVDGGTVTTTQMAFAGNFTVAAQVTKGAPVIAVKPG